MYAYPNCTLWYTNIPTNHSEDLPQGPPIVFEMVQSIMNSNRNNNRKYLFRREGHCKDPHPEPGMHLVKSHNHEHESSEQLQPPI